MTAHERYLHRHAVIPVRRKFPMHNPLTPKPGYRGVGSVYSAVPGFRRARDEEVRPSGIKNLSFGSSITPKLEEKIKGGIDLSLLKKPVVIHRGHVADDDTTAVAFGAHTLTGGTGRVILNEKFWTPTGQTKRSGGPRASWQDIVNHELVHATSNGKPTIRSSHTQETLDRKHWGEEARADAFSRKGVGIYREHSGVPTNREIRQMTAVGFPKEKLQPYKHYNDMHDKLHRVKHNEKVPELARQHPYLHESQIKTRAKPKVKPEPKPEPKQETPTSVKRRFLWFGRQKRDQEGRFAKRLGEVSY
jgi:hypothetical protein